MPAVELTQDEWSKILGIISTKCTWVEANPLLMKITQALQQPPASANKQQTNSGSEETPVESAQHDPPRRADRADVH